MNLVPVSVWTVEYKHGSHDKFYRTFAVTAPPGSTGWSVMQWGRNGTVGSFNCVSGVNSALTKRDEKENKGYARVPDQYNIQMDVDVDTFKAELANGGDRAAGEYLDSCFRRVRGGRSQNADKVTCIDCGAKFNTQTELTRHRASSHAPDVPDNVVPDRVGVLTDKANEILALAAEDPIKAQVQLAILRDSREKIALDLRRADSYIETAELLIEEADV